MKKLMMVLIAVFTVSMSWAQVSSGSSMSGIPSSNSPEAIKVRLKKAQKAVDHPKKTTKSSSWMKYATVLNEAFHANIRYLFIGADINEVMKTMGNPLNADAITVEEVGDKKFKLFKFDFVDVYVDGEDKVAMFIDKQPIMEGALEAFNKASQKAYELDNKLVDKVNPLLKNVINAYIILMQKELTYGNFQNAIDAARNAAIVQQHPAVQDAAYLESYYYAAVCAMNGSLYEEARKDLQVLYDKNDMRDGEIHYYLGYAEDQLGNTDKAKAIYEEGIAKYADNEDLMKALIDIYIRTKEESSKIIPFIKKAQEVDPKNVALYIAEGVAYEKMNQINNSIEAYKKAIEIDDNSFNAYYNLGYSYSILADNIANEINEMVKKKVVIEDSMYEKINEARAACLPYLERAYELNSEDINTVTLLKSLYFALRNESATMQAKFEKYNGIFKTLKQQ